MTMRSRVPLSMAACFLLSAASVTRAAAPPAPAPPAAAPLSIDTGNLQLSIDVANCRWSAQVKNTPMQLNNVHFLPGDDASGWTIASAVNDNDNTMFGPFVTVTLHGTKPGQLDFDYQISAAKSGSDLLVSLGRANNTGHDVDITDMDYFISSDARLGGTADKWVDIGTHSRNRDYYDLWSVANLITPKEYEVNHVVPRRGVLATVSFWATSPPPNAPPASTSPPRGEANRTACRSAATTASK